MMVSRTVIKRWGGLVVIRKAQVVGVGKTRNTAVDKSRRLRGHPCFIVSSLSSRLTLNVFSHCHQDSGWNSLCAEYVWTLFHQRLFRHSPYLKRLHAFLNIPNCSKKTPFLITVLLRDDWSTVSVDLNLPAPPHPPAYPWHPAPFKISFK